MARTLEIQIIGDDRSYRKALGSASKQTAGFGSSLEKMAKAGVLAAGAAGVGALFVTLKTGFSEIMESQKVMAQTNAVIKSTGGIAKVSAKDVETLSASLSQMSGVDDELIQTGANLLLTFKNVRNEVGAGNAVFDRATKSALNLSVAGFGSIESASKMMGKALNDPIKGMTALGRAGVTFSEDQKKAIEAMTETGHLMGAQKVILKEVESQVGGSAKAYGETLPGQLAKAKNAFGEVSGELTMALLPAVTKSLEGFTKFMSWVQANWPKWKQIIIENARPVIEILTKLWSWIQTNVIPVFVQLAKVAMEEWRAIAKVFQEHGPEIRRILERVTAVVGPLAKAWLFLAQEVVIPIVKPLFTVVIPTALKVTIVVLDALTGAIAGVISALKWIGNNAAAIVKGFANSAQGPISLVTGAFNVLAGAANAVRSAVEALARAIRALPSLPSFSLPKIPGFQHGVRNFKGGLAVLGERGPELVALPRGTDVFSNRESRQMAAGGGSGASVNVNIENYNAFSARDPELIASAVARRLAFR